MHSAASIVLACAFLLAFVPLCQGAEIAGRASVVDGDTIEIAGKRIRLDAIDAPESRQTCQRDGKDWRCGQESALALANHIGSQVVTCNGRNTDRYKRILAVCYLGAQQEVSLNGWMVEQGWALAYRYYSKEFARQEEDAKAAKRGIWMGAFQEPWEWRRRQQSR